MGYLIIAIAVPVDSDSACNFAVLCSSTWMGQKVISIVIIVDICYNVPVRWWGIDVLLSQ